MSMISLSRSPHFYLVKNADEIGLYSRLRDAQAEAGRSPSTVWEFFDNGHSGALCVVENGHPTKHHEFEHDRSKEPFTLIPSAVAHTRNGKIPKALKS